MMKRRRTIVFYSIRCIFGVFAATLEQVVDWSCPKEYEFVLTTKDTYYPLIQELSYIRPLRMLSPAMFTSENGIARVCGSVVAPVATTEYGALTKFEGYLMQVPRPKNMPSPG